MRIRPGTALLVVLGNAVVMGAVGVSAPIGWLLVPGVAGMWSRPRVAALLAGWAAALIAVSVELPNVPGHRGDGWSLAASGICLALMPAVSWARQRARRHTMQGAGPTVNDVGAGVVDRIVVLATSHLPGEIAAAVPGRGFGVRVVVGVVMGEVADQRCCARAVEREFRAAAARADRDLPQVAAALEPVTRRYAGTGFVAATLVEVSHAGVVKILRCGGPEILAMPNTSAGLDRSRCVVVDRGPAYLPLGLGCEALAVRGMPDNARIAVVTAGYACAHYDDYVDAVHWALQSSSAEYAAVQLLIGPARTWADITLAGPALVVDAVAPSS